MPDKVRINNDQTLAQWAEGKHVYGVGDEVVGTVLRTGVDDDGYYALVELTPEARGIAPAEDDAELFG